MKLDKLVTFNGSPGPVLVIVADGMGLAPDGPANAISQAKTPHIDALLDSAISLRLNAHGTYVGLPTDAELPRLGGLDAETGQGDRATDVAFAVGRISTAETWSQTYGYFEVEAKIPRGQGRWPAFWLSHAGLGADSEGSATSTTRLAFWRACQLGCDFHLLGVSPSLVLTRLARIAQPCSQSQRAASSSPSRPRLSAMTRFWLIRL